MLLNAVTEHAFFCVYLCDVVVLTRSLLNKGIRGDHGISLIIESFRFDYEYEYEYDYEIRHFWRQLLASSRADVIKS